MVAFSSVARRELQPRPNPWPPRPFPCSVLLSVVPRHPAAPSAIKHAEATTTKTPMLEIFIVVLIFPY